MIYLDYDRFCDLKERETDFICLLQADARVDVLEHIQDVGITDEQGTRVFRDELIELARLASNSAALSSKMSMARNSRT